MPLGVDRDPIPILPAGLLQRDPGRTQGLRFPYRIHYVAHGSETISLMHNMLTIQKDSVT